ncbi:MAG TPA: Rossmann fold nucleotide-binding protein [Nocardioides sp.]|nr:Rossmann fold nucleotide-binding protein [Nocardioides sp.]
MRKTRGHRIRMRPPTATDAQVAAQLAVPFDPHRTALYTARELYDAEPYADSLDARTYAWSREPVRPEGALAMVLHDGAIDAALTSWIQGRSLVGVMGGHAVERGQPAYDDTARLGHLLGATHVVATGGGPGAMEAANLGARLAGLPAETVAEASRILAGVPGFRPSIDGWVARAQQVCERFPSDRPSLGVPTWFYGHEPSNLFATAIAKYFRNALREAILLQICGAGIVFMEGVGGTVQEVFQDACENYYADEADVAPMVLVGRRYWTETLPAWPLLQALAKGRAMESHIHLVDSVDEAADVLGQLAMRSD